MIEDEKNDRKNARAEEDKQKLSEYNDEMNRRSHLLLVGNTETHEKLRSQTSIVSLNVSTSKELMFSCRELRVLNLIVFPNFFKGTT